MKLKFLALCAPIAMLAACGGGDSSPPPTGGGGGGGGGTPTPTPPPNTYTKFAEMTGDRAFDGACAEYAIDTSVSPALGSPMASRMGEGSQFEYDASAQTWTVLQPTSGGALAVVATFTQADLLTSPPTYTTGYAKPNANGEQDELLFVDAPATGIPLEYVRIADFRRAIESNSPGFFAEAQTNCVYGVPTLSGEAFQTGDFDFGQVSVYGYAIRRTGPAFDSPFEVYDLGESSATLTANYINGFMTTSVDLKGRLIQTDGSRSASITQFPKLTEGTGNFRVIPETKGVNMAYSGQFTVDGIRGFDFFEGWFFGPQGVEAGYAFSVSPGAPLAGETDFSEYKIIGVVVARR